MHVLYVEFLVVTSVSTLVSNAGGIILAAYRPNQHLNFRRPWLDDTFEGRGVPIHPVMLATEDSSCTETPPVPSRRRSRDHAMRHLDSVLQVYGFTVGIERRFHFHSVEDASQGSVDRALRKKAPWANPVTKQQRSVPPLVIHAEPGVSSPSSISKNDRGRVLDARVQFPVLEVSFRLELLWVWVELRVSCIRPMYRSAENGYLRDKNLRYREDPLTKGSIRPQTAPGSGTPCTRLPPWTDARAQEAQQASNGNTP